VRRLPGGAGPAVIGAFEGRGVACASLCQRGDQSCAACCGLYNRADLSRRAVREDLRRSSALFARTPRTPEGYRAAATLRRRELPPPLIPSVRLCPLLGFLDADESRVGCLGHPAVTGGPDLRAFGAYDLLTCEAFLCPSHAHLSEAEAALAAAAAGDFFLYGLLVTDARFVQTALSSIEALAGIRPEPADLGHPPFLRALRALFAMKEELAPGSEGHYGAFRTGQTSLLREVTSRLEACATALEEAARRGGGDPVEGR